MGFLLAPQLGSALALLRLGQLLLHGALAGRALGERALGGFHRASALEMSEDLPVLVEIVDAEERIQAFLPVLDGMLEGNSALVTLEKVQVLRYGADAMRPPA